MTQLKNSPAVSVAFFRSDGQPRSWRNNAPDEVNLALARAGLSPKEDRKMGPQEKAVRVQLGIICIALDVLLTKRLDYSGTENPFLNFEDYYFPEDSRAKNAWKRLGDKLRRIVNVIRRGSLEGESIFTNDIPDAVNYLTGIIAPLLLEDANDPSMGEAIIACSDDIEKVIKNLKERSKQIDANNVR